jgi:hypothetical protein
MSYSGFGSFSSNGVRKMFRIVIGWWHKTDESNVMKQDTENSNLSRISSTADDTSSSVKIVDRFEFVEVKCEVAVSTVNYFSLSNEATPPAQLTELQMNSDWMLNGELRV